MESELQTRPKPFAENLSSKDAGSNGAGHTAMKSAAALPDSASERASFKQVALNWVGMRGIAMPVSFSALPLHACPAVVGAWVDLADSNARGIHMSRLYTVLQSHLSNQRVDSAQLRRALDAMLESQSQLSGRAQIDIAVDVMLSRPALLSSLCGWQRYPVTLRARKSEAGFEFEVEWLVGYSSTCPSSAALAQHVQAEAFLARFGDHAVSATEVAEWLQSSAGIVATAHAQRSEARVRVRLGTDTPVPEVATLIDRCDAALGTPLQTAVKRIDEQEFAKRNAQNLMFCEDAARRLYAAFASDREFTDFDLRVSHFESLHAHDAVASVSASGHYQSLAVSA